MDKASWIEVSLQVTPEQVEAVAELLGRFTQEGVVIEQISDPGEISEISTLEDTVKVYGYLFADETIEEKKMRLEESLFFLGKIQPLPTPKYKFIHDLNWMEAWKKHYHPLKVGNKLAILPSWAENNYPARIPIRIMPGMAFGTGTHPTTKLCLELIENCEIKDQPIFDIGCGSGILSIAAAKLGASHVYGVDISPSAVSSSKENAKLNQVSEYVEFHQGSVTEIISGCFGVFQAPLVIANILASVILRLFDDGLASLVEPGGTLILSGILNSQIAEVQNKASNFGFHLSKTLEINDWVAVSLQK